MRDAGGSPITIPSQSAATRSTNTRGVTGSLIVNCAVSPSAAGLSAESNARLHQEIDRDHLEARVRTRRERQRHVLLGGTGDVRDQRIRTVQTIGLAARAVADDLRGAEHRERHPRALRSMASARASVSSAGDLKPCPASSSFFQHDARSGRRSRKRFEQCTTRARSRCATRANSMSSRAPCTLTRAAARRSRFRSSVW